MALMVKGKELILMVRALSHEKDIPEKEILDAVEKSFAAVIRKHMGVDAEIEVNIDSQKGNFDIHRLWTVIDSEDDFFNPESQLTLEQAQERFPDQEIHINGKIKESIPELPSEDLGRIAASVFRQGIMENVRKAERLKIVDAYSQKKGTLFTGTVKMVKREYILMDVNMVEALMLREETLPRESFRVGDRVRAYLFDVHYEPRGPQLFFSRKRPEMLKSLFEMEVPEVAEGVIEIKACARDPGHRAKIAVRTNDGRRDPVGACIGMRGVRIQAISNELGGERIDVVLWDDNPPQFVINAMSPAEVVSLLVEEDKHSMDVIVKEEQLSKAIGSGGQNIRLASELTGWKLSIMTEQESKNKQENEIGSLLDLFKTALDVDEDVAGILISEGFNSLEEIAYVEMSELMAIDGFDEEIVIELQSRAKASLETKDEVTLDSDLLNLEGMTEEFARLLASKQILKRDDLAELSVDDLVELTGISEKEAAQLIVLARSHWFE